MDGGTVTKEVWVYDRGRAGGHYETVEYQISDRDVSRIEAGGYYSTENTIMEDSSVNRARQDADMTEAELEATIEQNVTDVQIIEDSFDGATEAISAPVAEGGTLLGDIADTAVEAVLPCVLAYKGAKIMAEQFDSTEDKLGYGAIAAGAGAYIGTTTVGVAAAGIWGTWCLAKLAYKTVMRLA